MSLLKYSAACTNCRKCELQAIDRKNRKLFRRLHPKPGADRLYRPTKSGGGGLIAIEDCVEFAVKGLEVMFMELRKDSYRLLEEKI